MVPGEFHKASSMSKSILVLEENSVIHGLIASALDVEGVTVHHEFNPQNYAERASALSPDLILIGNSDQDPQFDVYRSIKGDSSLDSVPVVMMANSRDSVTQEMLDELQVAGVVRKPFEANDLQQQVSKHLNIADLVGSFEYRQSQETREDQTNPLENLDVVDPELRGMISGEEAPEPPHVASVVEEDVLSDALQPEGFFEAVEEGGDEFDTTTLSELEGDTLDAEEGISLETLESVEPLDDEFPMMETPSSEESLEELGAADLLEDEMVAEEVLSPQEFDQPLEASMADSGADEVEELALDAIEVDLEEQEESFAAMDEELGSDIPMSMGENGDSTPGEAEFVEENIPLSVKHMMDAKPGLQVDESLQDDMGMTADDGLVFEPGSEEEYITDELIQLDAFDVGAEEDFSAGVEAEKGFSAGAGAEPEPEPFDDMPMPSEAGMFGGEDASEFQGIEVEDEEFSADSMGEEDDAITDEYLGNEEIDEESILKATQEEESMEVGPIEGDLGDLDEFVSAEGLGEATPLTEGLEVNAEDDLSGPNLADISALEEQETLIERNFKSLDEEGAAWAAEQEAGFEAPEKVDEWTEIEDEPVSPDAESGLDAMEPVEETLSDAFDEGDEMEVMEPLAGADETMFMPMGEGDGEDDLMDPPLGVPPGFIPKKYEEFPEDALRPPFVGPESEGDSPTPVPRHKPDEVLEDPDSLSPVLESEEMLMEEAEAQDEFAAMDDAFEDTSSGDGSSFFDGVDVEDVEVSAGEDGDLSFDDAFASLRDDIEKNPEGEKLDDVLRMEGIRDRVGRLDFSLPQNESTFSRGMGVYSLADPSESPSDFPKALWGDGSSPTQVRLHPESISEGLGLTANADGVISLLDQDTRNKLGEVLDEIISLSVRKAVQEEMPKMMERLVKDDPRT